MPRLQMNKTITAVALLTLMLVAGCGADDKSPVTVKGEIGIAGDAPIPAGANARVSLSEQGGDGAEKRIVAERTLHDLDKKPIAFKLQVARNLLDPQTAYELSAEVIAEDGDVLWHSRQPQGIKPLQQDKAVRMQLEKTEQDAQRQFQKYRCEDGFKLSAWNNKDQAIVRLGNRRLELEAKKKSSTYVDKHDNTLGVTDSGVDMHIDGAAHNSCEPVEETTAQPTSSEPTEVEAQSNDDRENDADQRPSQTVSTSSSEDN